MRTTCVLEAKRIVIKVGTAVITTENGGFDHARLKGIVNEILGIKKRFGYEVVIVSSGAIAIGMEQLRMTERPKQIPELQAAAAVGQSLLVQEYGKNVKSPYRVGQVLLTQYDITHREHYVNAANTFEKLFELGVIPIVNENDTTVVEEIKYGDNDELAALVTNLIKADLLVIMSDVAGFYNADPQKDANAKIIHEVKGITPEIEKMAGGPGSMFGSGGMQTKLKAAKIVTSAGAGMLMIDGKKERVLTDIFFDDSEQGTFFPPRTGKKMPSRKAWIAFGTRPKGTIVVDDGARDAILKGGKSLLAAGIVACKESFDSGDTVSVNDAQGNHIATGISNLNAKEIRKISGLKREEIEKKYPDLAGREVVHRDCLVILK